MKLNRQNLKKIIIEETKTFLLKKHKLVAEQENSGRGDAGTKEIIRGKAAERQKKIKQKIIQKEKERIQQALALGYLKDLHLSLIHI